MMRVKNVVARRAVPLQKERFDYKGKGNMTDYPFKPNNDNKN
jgi:hypothetical protein